MGAINMEDLDAMVEKGRELKKLLSETPEILRFAECAKDCREAPILVAQSDVLIRAQAAAEILCVSKSTIYSFVQQGLLDAYVTPGSFHKKFWLSQVKAIAKKEENQNGRHQQETGKGKHTRGSSRRAGE